MKRAPAAFAVLIAGCTSAAAQGSFYNGKTIRLIVTSAASSSYDVFARTLVRHLPRSLAGQPSVVVQNMPGAGGLIGANHMATLADKDGTVIGLLNRNSLLQPIVGNKQARYRTQDFYWLGTPSTYRDDPYLFVAHASVPAKSAEEMRKLSKPVQVGNSGAVMIDLLKETTGLNVNIVSGYDKSVLDLAFQRKEVDAIGTSYANGLVRFPGMLERGEIRAIVQFGSEKRSPVLPDVPTARELAVSPEARALLAFIEAPLSIPFPYAMPPGVPADRAAAMRKAFDDVFATAAYRDDIVAQKLLHAPKSGADVEREVNELVQAPASVVARYREVAGKGSD